MSVKVDATLCSLVLHVVDKGLVGGTVGKRKPGEMCVEAAVAYASGEPHHDHPSCVYDELASLKINLNDELTFKSNAHRAKALRRIAIAQLGTANQKGFWGAFKKALEKRFAKIGAPIAAKLEAPYLARLKKAKTLEEVQDIVHNIPTEVTDDAGWLRDPEYLTDGPANHYDEYSSALTVEQYIEVFVQALIDVKTPGSKFLSLTKGKAKKLSAAAAKRLKELEVLSVDDK